MRPLPRHGLCHDGSAIVFGPGSVFLALPRLPWRGHGYRPSCETCDGQGRTPSHEKIDIDIPAGVSTGRQLRVSGFGEAGLRGEPSGDLIVNVRVADHERFKRNGDDLYLVSDISIAQAALGCEIDVEALCPTRSLRCASPPAPSTATP